jgi:hypothetical protein
MTGSGNPALIPATVRQKSAGISHGMLPNRGQNRYTC